MSEMPKILILKETMMASIIKDAVSFGTLIGTVGVGIWLDSSALQWIAGLAWILWLTGKAFGTNSRNTFTIQQARKRLDEIENGAAGTL